MNKIVITSGAMEEKIDNIRTLINKSSGKLGSVIADTFKDQQVTYIHTSSAMLPTTESINKIKINNISDLVKTLKREVKDADIVIHLMAVSDFSYQGYTTKDNPNKVIKSDKINSEEDILLVMKRNAKVIDKIKEYNQETKLVGFKLLSNVSQEELKKACINLKERANCDIVVGNILENISEEQHKALILSDDDIFVNTKEDIALALKEELL